jgi:acetylornithine deacetylase
LKAGPVLWIDSADSQPCVGTAGSITWHLKASGKLFHSGLPHKAINAIELASEAVKYIQDEFYKDFPAHANEDKWQFVCPSSLKPTQVCQQHMCVAVIEYSNHLWCLCACLSLSLSLSLVYL